MTCPTCGAFGGMTPILLDGLSPSFWCPRCTTIIGAAGEVVRQGESPMAKEKKKSRAEELAEQLKDKPQKKKTVRYPRHVFAGGRLEALRTKHGLKRYTVAKETGVSESYLGAIEHGADPKLSAALKLAEFFGEDAAKLFGEFKLYEHAEQPPAPPPPPPTPAKPPVDPTAGPPGGDKVPVDEVEGPDGELFPADDAHAYQR